jgi:hypothetical protein
LEPGTGIVRRVIPVICGDVMAARQKGFGGEAFKAFLFDNEAAIPPLPG